MKAIEAIERRLRAHLRKLGASSCTFYVEDPWWPDELRLVLMPNVKYREPMQGFLLPISARRFVTEGEAERFCADAQSQCGLIGTDESVPQDLVARMPLYGNFAQREGIQSYARFIHRVRGKTSAVLFVNFDRRTEFDSRMRQRLRNMKQEAFNALTVLKMAVQGEDPFPVPQLLRLLQSSEDHLDSSVEANMKRILDIAFDVAGLDAKKDVGTVHLFDERKRVIRLVEKKGELDGTFLENFNTLNVDQGHGIVSWVALRQREILIDNLRESKFRPIYVRTRDGISSELAVPILGGEHLVGVLNLESSKRRFTPQCLRAIWCLANQAAARYRRTHLVQSLFRIWSAAPERIGQPHPLDDLAELLREHLYADLCDIWLFNEADGGFEAVGVTDPSLEPDEPPRPQGEGWSHFIRTKATPVLINEIKNRQEFCVQFWNPTQSAWQLPGACEELPTSVSPFLVKLKVNEEVGIPIVTEDHCIGVAWLKYRNYAKAPRNPYAMVSSSFLGRVALALIGLQRQQRQQQASSVEGMRLLLRGLRHEAIGKITDSLMERIRDAKDADTLLGRREDLLTLVEFLDTYISNLRWVSGDPSGGKREDLPIEPESLELRSLVEVATRLADLIMRKPDCRNEVPHGLTVFADKRLLLLLLFNLVQNAKKFTSYEKKEEHIIISARAAEAAKTNVVVTVDDAGFGIPEDLAGQLFVKSGVHRNPPGRIVSGSGFGLYLCNKIAVAHGGKMMAPQRSRRGGALMGVLLPQH